MLEKKKDFKKEVKIDSQEFFKIKAPEFECRFPLTFFKDVEKRKEGFFFFLQKLTKNLAKVHSLSPHRFLSTFRYKVSTFFQE